MIQEALEEISDEDSFQTALDLLSSKLKKTKANNDYELYAKLMRFASSRGIEMDMAHRIIQKLVNELDE